MDALNAYKNLLRELDKFESPTFTIQDFNYFFNVAISKYITDNYGDFDVIQKDLDDIRSILTYKQSLTFSGNTAPLPTDYRHCLGIELKLNVIKETLDNSVGDTLTVYPKRLKTNRKGYAGENAYQQPLSDYFTYQLDSENVIVNLGDTVQITKGFMDYIKVPDTVYLNPDRSVDYDDPLNNTPIQFSEYVTYEIIRVCRQIFLENIESPRYQTTLNENQITKTKE